MWLSSEKRVQCKGCFIPSRLNTTKEQQNANAGLTPCLLEREINNTLHVGIDHMIWKAKRKLNIILCLRAKTERNVRTCCFSKFFTALGTQNFIQSCSAKIHAFGMSSSKFPVPSLPAAICSIVEILVWTMKYLSENLKLSTVLAHCIYIISWITTARDHC